MTSRGGKAMLFQCSICRKDMDLRMKCPKCHTILCSSQCFKQHTCTPPPAPSSTAVAEVAEEPSSPPSAAAAAVRERLYDSAVQAAPSAYDEDGNLVVLQERHLVGLIQNQSLLNQLASKELKQLLRIILHSKSRFEALNAALENVPEFRAFSDEVLRAIYTQEAMTKSRV